MGFISEGLISVGVMVSIGSWLAPFGGADNQLILDRGQ
jgi:hypothetical protein